MPEPSATAAASPVDLIDTGSPHDTTEPGIAVCLSGGGCRAMLFHVGVLWRLYETGILGKVSRVSSVSGGSIAAALYMRDTYGIDFRGMDAMLERWNEEDPPDAMERWRNYAIWWIQETWNWWID